MFAGSMFIMIFDRANAGMAIAFVVVLGVTATLGAVDDAYNYSLAF